MGWFNPTDVDNSSKEGRGCTKTILSSSTCFEVSRPRKSIPTLSPQKRRNSLGSVNSKVRTWAPACSLLIQEAGPNRLRLASLPSKSCSYCNPDRRPQITFRAPGPQVFSLETCSESPLQPTCSLWAVLVSYWFYSLQLDACSGAMVVFSRGHYATQPFSLFEIAFIQLTWL